LGLRGRLGHNWPARDRLDIPAAHGDVAEIVVRELGQFAHRLSISAPSVQLIRDAFFALPVSGGIKGLLQSDSNSNLLITEQVIG
jgi:hypothetical protein